MGQQQWGIPWSNNGLYYGATMGHTMGYTMEQQWSSNRAYYGAAEEVNNLKHTRSETMTEIDHEGKLSQLIATETPTPTSNSVDS